MIVWDCILYVFDTCFTCECDIVFMKEAYCIVLTCIEHVEKLYIVNACLTITRYLFPRVETRDDCKLTYCLAKFKFGILSQCLYYNFFWISDDFLTREIVKLKNKMLIFNYNYQYS